MARRLISGPVRMKGGPTLGGTPTRLYIYDDEALTVLSTLYQRATGGGTQPNYLTPNAGKQTTLRSDAASGDTVLNVVSIASFNVGDYVPIFDGTNIRWRVITALNAVGPTMTIDQTLGVAFDSDNTFINRPSTRGHVWFWVDDVRDYFNQPYDVGAAEQMPPSQLPTRVPATALAVQEEGASVGTARSTLNFIGPNVLAVDNAGALRTDVTISGLATDVQIFTASGTWTKPAGVPKLVEILAWGGGGGGGGGVSNGSSDPRAGGGGGAAGCYRRRVFDPSVLGATETVTIGAAGTAGTAGTAGGPGAAGGNGGNTTFGAHMTAFGGGGGWSPGGVQEGAAGGGGGAGAAGAQATSGAAGAAGGPTTDPGGVGGGAAADGGSTENGGGGGGGVQQQGVGNDGGGSLNGPGGGGAGGGGTTGSVGQNGGDGGGYDSIVSATGGANGVGGASGTAGTAGTSRSGTGKSGDGGGGGGGGGTTNGAVGGAGGAPGGGGGGGGCGGSSGNGAAGAVGARGEMIVVTYF